MDIKLIILLFLFTSNCKNKTELGSQEIKFNITEEDSTIFTVVEEMPRFPGCEDKPKKERKSCADQKMLQYLYKNLKYNPISKEMGIEGTIVASFVIEKNGNISNIETIKGKGYTNIIEVLEKMPQWKPGTNKGEVKRVRFNIPIKINLK